MQQELKIRKTLGRNYLNENRLAEALDVFSRILIDYPDELETLIILGDFYLASGDGNTAKSIYLRAKQVDPNNKSIECQIALADEIADDGFGEPAPTDLPAVARLLQRLTGNTKSIVEDDIMRAALLLEKVVNSESPAELVSEKLNEIDELLPALIELNIRQAYADGHPDLAEGLRNLQHNIDSQLVSMDDPSRVGDHSSETPHFKGNVLMLLPDLENRSSRMSLLKQALKALNCQVVEKMEYSPSRDTKPDVVITSNPHINPGLMNSLSAISDAGIPIILDLDTDFELQPVSHHEYNLKGLGSQVRSNVYTAALSLAQMVTVPSKEHADSLKNVAQQIRVIPDGWSRQNKLWEKDPPPHATINIGWVGTVGQLEDLVFIRRYIIRIIREFPNTRVVIIGNPQAYRLFESLPENRRLYLPVVAHEEFPYLLSQLDVLLVPLRNTPYNHSLPDSILMEAGARSVPWIASMTPEFRRWHSGGILCETSDEWHLNLRHLVIDGSLRYQLGETGKHAARLREMSELGKLWIDVVNQVGHARGILLPNTESIPAFSPMEY